MSFRQNVNQQLRDAGYDDVADRVELLLSDTVPSNRNAPLQISHNESNEDLPLSGYGEDTPDPISEFKAPSDPIPDPGNFPPPHKHNSDRVQNMTNGWNSDLSVYYNAPQHTHRVYDCHPQKQVRYDISSLQMSQYASNRSFSNDSSISPPDALSSLPGVSTSGKGSAVRYAIATDTIPAISGTTVGAGPAVLAEIINGAVQPVVGEFRKQVGIGQLGFIRGVERQGVDIGVPPPPGPAGGGDPLARRNTVWTITPTGSVMGTDRPYEGILTGLTSASTAGQLFPYYSFEDNGNDLSGHGLNLTATSAAYSSTSKIGSKSGRFQGAGHFNIAHNDAFTASVGGGLRVSFWYRVVTSPTISSLQGVITKGDFNGSTFNGEWGIFHNEAGASPGASDPDLYVVIKASGAATQVLTSRGISTGVWYFVDFGINNNAGTFFINLRGPLTTNDSGTITGGSVVADTSTDVRIGNNTAGAILGATSKDVLVDGVSFSKDLTTSTDTLYNSGTGILTSYDGTDISAYLPNANETLITGTYQVQNNRNVYSAVDGTAGAVRPAIKITKPANSSDDISIEVGTSTSKYISDFTADPSVATVTQTSDPKGATVEWNGRFEGYPIDISDSDNGYIVSSTSARASECLVKVTAVGKGAQNIGRANETQGPQDSENTVAAGASVRNPHFGESVDPVAKAKERGYSPGGAITVRNPTGSSYSNGNVIKVQNSGNGWIII